MNETTEGEGRPYRKLTPEERDRFLEVLRQTGNRHIAAEAIGAEARAMRDRRAHDAELDRGGTRRSRRRIGGCPPPKGRSIARRTTGRS